MIATSIIENKQALFSLRKRWALSAALSLSTLLGGFILLGSQGLPAWRWLLPAFLGYGYLLAVLWKGLEANRRLGEDKLLPDLGAGNVATLLRGGLLALLAGFLLLPASTGWLAWIPGVLYTLAIIADYLDGYLARVTDHATRLGEVLDMSFDGLGVLVAVLLGVRDGRLPDWYLVIGFARYAYLVGAWLRTRRGLPVYELPPSLSRRGLAGLQMGFLSVALWPVFSPDAVHLAALGFGLPFLAGFLRDWLLHTGVIRPAFSERRQEASLTRWAPLALRLAVGLLAAASLFAQGAASTLSDPLILGAGGLVAALILLGAAGRVAAIAGMLLLGFGQLLASPWTIHTGLLAAYLGVLFLGTGPFSLWTPEENLIHRRAGERPQTETAG